MYKSPFGLMIRIDVSDTHFYNSNNSTGCTLNIISSGWHFTPHFLQRWNFLHIFNCDNANFMTIFFSDFANFVSANIVTLISYVHLAQSVTITINLLKHQWCFTDIVLNFFYIICIQQSVGAVRYKYIHSNICFVIKFFVRNIPKLTRVFNGKLPQA